MQDTTNKMNEVLVEKIKQERNIFLTPSNVKGKFIIRFVVCGQSTNSEDILFSFNEIKKLALSLLNSTQYLERRHFIEASSDNSSIDSHNPKAIKQSTKAEQITNKSQQLFHNYKQQAIIESEKILNIY